ncbi:hypothetical protein [Entomobacter blattae]|uniref:Uncharacterized protein n=1 Tax=Entomobacter blattae TaxID=2762277 RepID=A0A7H1NTS0_9PROT|nr:hypothetical protein [Entomobacter blattae]QNT79180.1 hypothetical protein JGUZn3_19750 [Entomobacter blattae]
MSGSVESLSGLIDRFSRNDSDIVNNRQFYGGLVSAVEDFVTHGTSLGESAVLQHASQAQHVSVQKVVEGAFLHLATDIMGSTTLTSDFQALKPLQDAFTALSSEHLSHAEQVEQTLRVFANEPGSIKLEFVAANYINSVTGSGSGDLIISTTTTSVYDSGINVNYSGGSITSNWIGGFGPPPIGSNGYPAQGLLGHGESYYRSQQFQNDFATKADNFGRQFFGHAMTKDEKSFFNDKVHHYVRKEHDPNDVVMKNLLQDMVSPIWKNGKVNTTIVSDPAGDMIKNVFRDVFGRDPTGAEMGLPFDYDKNQSVTGLREALMNAGSLSEFRKVLAHSQPVKDIIEQMKRDFSGVNPSDQAQQQDIKNLQDLLGNNSDGYKTINDIRHQVVYSAYTSDTLNRTEDRVQGTGSSGRNSGWNQSVKDFMWNNPSITMRALQNSIIDNDQTSRAINNQFLAVTGTAASDGQNGSWIDNMKNNMKGDDSYGLTNSLRDLANVAYNNGVYDKIIEDVHGHAANAGDRVTERGWADRIGSGQSTYAGEQADLANWSYNNGVYDDIVKVVQGRAATDGDKVSERNWANAIGAGNSTYATERANLANWSYDHGVYDEIVKVVQGRVANAGDKVTERDWANQIGAGSSSYDHEFNKLIDYSYNQGVYADIIKLKGGSYDGSANSYDSEFNRKLADDIKAREKTYASGVSDYLGSSELRGRVENFVKAYQGTTGALSSNQSSLVNESIDKLRPDNAAFREAYVNIAASAQTRQAMHGLFSKVLGYSSGGDDNKDWINARVDEFKGGNISAYNYSTARENLVVIGVNNGVYDTQWYNKTGVALDHTSGSYNQQFASDMIINLQNGNYDYNYYSNIEAHSAEARNSIEGYLTKYQDISKVQLQSQMWQDFIKQNQDFIGQYDQATMKDFEEQINVSADTRKVRGNAYMDVWGTNPSPELQQRWINEHKSVTDLRKEEVAYKITYSGSNAAIPLLDKDGNPLYGASVNKKGEHKLLQYPNGYPPQMFIEAGQKIAQNNKILEQVKSTASLSGISTIDIFKIGNTFLNLANFVTGGPWDFQRIDSRDSQTFPALAPLVRLWGGLEPSNPEFLDISTVYIGLYSAAMGLSESEILSMQDVYAAKLSNFGEGKALDSTYTHLPKTNVENTLMGFKLYHDLTGK